MFCTKASESARANRLLLLLLLVIVLDLRKFEHDYDHQGGSVAKTDLTLLPVSLNYPSSRP
ncbi:MAG: hypothetical protein H0V54_05030 [Chthoniobacterales bacterium]|nr:hypothetical protein [Chthoniobacterales bacterium]